MNKNRGHSRCYLCNFAFAGNKVYENMFDKRYNAAGIEKNTLAAILAAVLGYKLQQNQLHSPYMCSTCKVSLLNFEQLQWQLWRARLDIQEAHRRTCKLYETELKADNSLGEAEDREDLAEQQHESLEHADFADIADLIEECSSSDEYTEGVVQQPVINSNQQPNCQSPQRLKSPSQWCCSHCGKTFERRLWLLEHERTHTGERPLKCEHCDARFAQQANLRSHTLATHSQLAKFKCDECGRAFKRQRLLNNHIKSVHDQQRDLSCEQCDAAFSNPINLKKHMLCHTGEKNYSCKICGKEFSRAENRNVHQFVHSISKPYACVVCNEGFMRKQQLQLHITTTKHANPKIVRLKPQFSAANNDKLLQRPSSTPNTRSI